MTESNAMNKNYASRGNNGSAYIATLVLFIIMVSMITLALRANGIRRTELRIQADVARAFSLAESGLAEAIHALSLKAEAGELEGRIGHGVFSATWTPIENRQNIFRVVARGTMPTRLPAPMRKTVHPTVNLLPQTPGQPPQAQVLSWSQTKRPSSRP